MVRVRVRFRVRVRPFSRSRDVHFWTRPLHKYMFGSLYGFPHLNIGN